MEDFSNFFKKVVKNIKPEDIPESVEDFYKLYQKHYNEKKMADMKASAEELLQKDLDRAIKIKMYSKKYYDENKEECNRTALIRSKARYERAEVKERQAMLMKENRLRKIAEDPDYLRKQCERRKEQNARRRAEDPEYAKKQKEISAKRKLQYAEKKKFKNLLEAIAFPDEKEFPLTKPVIQDDIKA